MTKLTSIYLDLIRLLAALAVLLAHSFGLGITGGFLWPLAGYGATAVMVFFVLSGYVISFVVYSRESSFCSYLCARVARISSVAVPALLITIVCNELGRHVLRPEYRGPWDLPDSWNYIRYLVTLIHAQRIWTIDLSPMNNGSFWSISFEVSYYLMFAALYFPKLFWHRALAFFAMLLIAGPTVSALFPIWGSGYLAFRIHASGWKIKSYSLSLIVFLLSILILAYSPVYRQNSGFAFEFIARESIVGDYVDAFACFLNLLAAPVVIERFSSLLFKFQRPIVAGAGISFAVYLFHLPLVRLFAGISPFIAEPGSLPNRIFVYFFAFLVIFTIGVPAERLKSRLNPMLRRLLRCA